jgi:N-acetylglucosamine-6-phosphate deacetylase
MHGGGGFSNEDGPDAILAALSAHRAHGTTRAVISFVANPIRTLCRSLSAVAELADRSSLVLGSHLEGPFLAASRKGAHSAAHLTDPTADNVDCLLGAARGTLRQITVDPDRAGAQTAIATLRAAGVAVAVGHTDADYDTAARAFAQGASLLTHAFNAMPGMHHRAPGPVVAAIDNPAATLELVLDGVHVHPRMAALLFGAAPGRIALVTDAMAAAAASDGDYVLGDTPVQVANGRARIAGTDTLAGSTLTLDAALRLGLDVGIPAEAMVAALTLTPARVLGLESQFGLLAAGYAADFVLLDQNWHVVETFADGRREAASDARGT